MKHRCHRKPTSPHSKPRVVKMPTLSSLMAPEVVVMTTSGAASDDKVGIVTTHGFQWRVWHSTVSFIGPTSGQCRSNNAHWEALSIVNIIRDTTPFPSLIDNTSITNPYCIYSLLIVLKGHLEKCRDPVNMPRRARTGRESGWFQTKSGLAYILLNKCKWRPLMTLFRATQCADKGNQDSKVQGANMGPTWVLSAPDGPHVGPMNLAVREHIYCGMWRHCVMMR